MKMKYKAAFTALKKMGVPVYEHCDDDGNFSISAEEPESYRWCDYYSPLENWEFGVNEEICELLRSKGLFAEWMNPGRLVVYEI